MKRLRAQFRTFESVFSHWSKNVTPTGKSLGLALLVCLPAVAALDSPLMGLFFALLTTLAVASVANFLSRPVTRCHFEIPSVMTAGAPANLTTVLRNVGRWPSFDLTIELVDTPPDWCVSPARQQIPAAAPSSTHNLLSQVCPPARGCFPLPSIRVTSTFPLNLLRRSRQVSPPGTITILPRFERLDQLDLERMSLSGEAGWANEVSVVSDGAVYSGSREYLPGQPVRRWDYPSWARLSQPVVREFGCPKRPPFCLLLDTTTQFSDTADGPEQLFEAAVSLCAGIVDRIAECERLIEWSWIGGSPKPCASSVHEFRAALMRELAVVQHWPTESTEAMLAAATRMPPSQGVVFLVFCRWDGHCAKMCEVLASKGYTARPLVVVADGTDLPDGPHHLSVSEILCGTAQIT